MMRPGDRLAHSIVGIAAAGLIFQAFDTIDLWFQSQVQSKNTVYAKNAAFLLTALVRAALVWVRAPLIAFAYAGLAEVGLGAVGLVIVYLVNGQRFALWQVSLSCAKRLLKASWPLIISSMAIVTYMKIDQIMLSEMVSDQAVGVYAAAIRISELWYFIPMAITTSLFPAIVNAKKISETLYLNRLQKLYDLLAWMSIGIAIPVTIFSEEIVKIVLGTEYILAADVLTVHIWAGIAVFLGVGSSQYLITENLTKLSFYRTFIGMILNIVLNFILIPSYGIIGSAVATLISFAVAVFSILVDKKANRQFFMMIKSIFFITIITNIKQRWLSR